jgi:hypothetical protein
LVSVLRDNPKICLKGDRDFLPTEKKNFKSWIFHWGEYLVLINLWV